MKNKTTIKNKAASKEDKREAIYLLKKSGVLQKYIDKMEFTESNNGNIKATLLEGDRATVVFMKNRNGLTGKCDSIPEAWLTEPLSQETCHMVMLSHPQREYIEKVICRSTPNGFRYSIKEREGIPFKLKESVSISGGSKQEQDAHRRFTETNLITGPSDSLREQAYLLINEKFLELKNKFRKAKFPQQVVEANGLKVFNTELTAPRLDCIIDNDFFVFNFAEFAIRYSIQDECFSEIKEPYSELFEKIMPYNEAAKSADRLGKKLKKNAPVTVYSIDFDFNDSSVVLNISYKNISKSYKIHPDSLEDDIQRVNDEHLKNLEEDENITKEILQNENKKLFASSVCGSLLAESIYSIVANNFQRNKGISTTALVKKVRGLNEPFYSEGTNSGKFNMIPEEDVLMTLNELKFYGLLDVRRKKGEYVVYDQIITGNKKNARYLTMRRMPDSFADYNDQDWIFELQHPSSKWEDKDVLSILDHTSVYCVYRDLYESYFIDASDEVKEYIKVMSKIGDKTTKKICKNICSRIAKSQTTN